MGEGRKEKGRKKERKGEERGRDGKRDNETENWLEIENEKYTVSTFLFGFGFLRQSFPT